MNPRRSGGRFKVPGLVAWGLPPRLGGTFPEGVGGFCCARFDVIFQDPSQVPEAPYGKFYFDRLRWMVAVMDDDDELLGFIASVLSYCIKNNGLSVKQGKAVDRIYQRVLEHHAAGYLDCQQIDDIESALVEREWSTLQ